MLLLFSHIFECQSIRMSVYAWTSSAFVFLLITVYKRTHFLFLFIFSLVIFFFLYFQISSQTNWDRKKNLVFFIQHTIFFFFLLVYMFVYDMKRNWIFQFISKCICFYIYTIKLTLSFHSISLSNTLLLLLADTYFLFFFFLLAVSATFFSFT